MPGKSGSPKKYCLEELILFIYWMTASGAGCRKSVRKSVRESLKCVLKWFGRKPLRRNDFMSVNVTGSSPAWSRAEQLLLNTASVQATCLKRGSLFRAEILPNVPIGRSAKSVSLNWNWTERTECVRTQRVECSGGIKCNFKANESTEVYCLFF